ncbi:hypothetical protein TNCV_262231 [Trichonephila clavipes]|nr:hypothetical protein TNCV_262231 [Trichonephila clavipes]
MRAFGDSPRNFEIWSRTTPELELSSPNYHTNGRTFKLDRFNVHRTPTRRCCAKYLDDMEDAENYRDRYIEMCTRVDLKIRETVVPTETEKKKL